MELIITEDNTQVITNYITEPDYNSMTIGQAVSHIIRERTIFDKTRTSRRQSRNKKFRFAI